jgi:hypothetical protein
MASILLATAFGAALSLVALAPAHAQSDQQTPGWQQSLHGLLNGNQQNDQQLRQAYERGFQSGYSRGRMDAARVGNNGSYTPNQGNYDQGARSGGW